MNLVKDIIILLLMVVVSLFLYVDDDPINYVNLTKNDVKVLIEDLSNLYSNP